MFNERIKTLRLNKGITQATLASKLNIAKTTLAAYEQGKNEPSIETLTKIADYFNVSIDYLLGRTDISSPDLKVAYISKFLGLKENSVKTLHMYQQMALKNDTAMLQKLDTINMLFSPHCELLNHISSYLHFSATHFKNFYDESNNSLSPISELELWDDVEKTSYSDDWDMWSKVLLLIIEEELLYLRKSYLEGRNNTTDK